MYQLTEDPDVIRCVETGAFIPRGHYLWSTEWLQTNTPPLAVSPDPGFELHTPAHYRYIRDQAFAWMRAEAVERGYDSIESCASYYNSGVARYRAEARAMVAWRDAMNQVLEQLVLAPPEGIETWERVRALLPQPETFVWPKKAEIDEALFVAGFERLEGAGSSFDGNEPAQLVLEQVTAALLADWERVTLVFARMMEEQQRQGDLHLLPERWAPIGERFEAFFLRGQRAGEFNVEFTAVWLADFYWTCFYGIAWSHARGRLAPAMAASTLLAAFQHGAMKG